MTAIAENYRRIVERIHAAAERSGRDPHSITFIAVTKTVSPERMREAAACGVRDVGENRFQEAMAKVDALKPLGLTWHFIGHLQTNKARKVAESFDCVHSIDRAELALKLDQYAAKPLPVLLEVKLHEEPNKSGVSPELLPDLVAAVRSCRHLRLQGLMAVPPFIEDPEAVRPYFRRLQQLARDFELKELSMGMTHDFEIAVEEGATMVRIGTGLFGSR